MTYDIDYFIDYYERRPERFWVTGSWRRGPFCGCATGLMGRAPDIRPELLTDAPFSELRLMIVNDGKDSAYLQSSPKQRVLAWLRDIKKSKSA